MRTLLHVLLAFGLSAPLAARAGLVVSPRWISFTPASPGGPTQFRYAQVTNMGNDAVTGLHVYNQCFGPIQVIHTCNSTLEPQQSCSLNVQFTPNSIGHIACDIEISSLSGAWGRLSVQADVR